MVSLWWNKARKYTANTLLDYMYIQYFSELLRIGRDSNQYCFLYFYRVFSSKPYFNLDGHELDCRHKKVKHMDRSNKSDYLTKHQCQLNPQKMCRSSRAHHFKDPLHLIWTCHYNCYWPSENGKVTKVIYNNQVWLHENAKFPAKFLQSELYDLVKSSFISFPSYSLYFLQQPVKIHDDSHSCSLLYVWLGNSAYTERSHRPLENAYWRSI